MNIHKPSLIRSGTVAAALAGLLLLFGMTPFATGFFAVLLLAALLLIPFGAGMYYGYLAPGHETTLQSAVGGILSGAIGGIVLGLALAVNQFMIGLVNVSLGMAIVSSAGVMILSGAVLGVLGAIFGAIGGILWQVVQR